MKTLLTDAGFVDVEIKIKENAKEFIKDWMPGSGAEEVITSAYVTATKPACSQGVRDNIRPPAPAPEPEPVKGGGCGPAAAGG